MKGFAIVIDGQIDVRTVCPSEIGAIVNWLVTGLGIILPRGSPDNMIRQFFEQVREGHPISVECCEVKIERVLQ